MLLRLSCPYEQPRPGIGALAPAPREEYPRATTQRRRSPMAEQAHVLVVANRTAGSEELLSALRERAEQGPARFHLVVPASPRGASWMFDMDSGHEAAEHDLDGALERLRGLGFEVDGEVGASDPVAA